MPSPWGVRISAYELGDRAQTFRPQPSPYAYDQKVSISSYVFFSLLESSTTARYLYLGVPLWPSSIKLISSSASFLLRTFHKTNNVFSFLKLEASQVSSTPLSFFLMWCWPNTVNYHLFFLKKIIPFLPDYSQRHRPGLSPATYLHYSFSDQTFNLFSPSHVLARWISLEPAFDYIFLLFRKL